MQEQAHKVSFHTLGCRLNIFETDGLAAQLEKLGVQTVDSSENPHAIVINTCTVTNRADSKNRNIIRNAIKNHPGSQIWVTGCYAETDKSVIENIPGVTGVIGNSDKSSLPYLLVQSLGQDVMIPKSLDRFSYSDTVPKNHTRAYLKIQDGCNRVCSYCKIPQARGKGVSREEADVLDQVRFLQDQGIGEIVLTGVNLGWYRDSEQRKSFGKLVQKILNILEYSRLRISSIEPSDVNEELAQLMQHPRFCNFLHVPLQSGNSSILRKMKRSYSKETFLKRVEIIKKYHPNVFIGTDVITGFPGEGDAEFQDSIDTLVELGIARVHAFPYSERKGTKATEFPDHIPKEVKKERVHLLYQATSKIFQEYVSKQNGKIEEGILEADGTILTGNFLKVKLKDSQAYQKLQVGQFVNVQISGERIDSEFVLGNLKI
jgi:threonylcarbamoyladenosine tRNA methylthiotransferase MtaB